MCPHTTCPRGCKVTLATFERFFSRMSFQMCFQIAYLNRCIVTLVAFVRLFPGVCFQMCLEVTSMREFILALIAFVVCVHSGVQFVTVHTNFVLYNNNYIIFLSIMRLQFLKELVLIMMKIC